MSADQISTLDPVRQASGALTDPHAKWLSPLVMLIGVAAAATAALIVPASTMQAFIVENGPAQAATAVMWLALAAALVVYGLQSGRPALILAMLAAIAGLREMDGHVIFTSGSITKTSYWINGSIPLSEKVLAGLALLAIISLLAYGLRRDSAGLWHLMRSGDAATWSVLTVAIGISGSMLIDGVPRYYRDITGIPMDASLKIISSSVEEIGEMFLPVIGLIGLGQYSQRNAG